MKTEDYFKFKTFLPDLNQWQLLFSTQGSIYGFESIADAFGRTVGSRFNNSFKSFITSLS